MIQFANREQLISAWLNQAPNLHRQFGLMRAKHVPHLYRGGYVIPGFGYSVERIGVYITADKSGNPFLVEGHK